VADEDLLHEVVQKLDAIMRLTAYGIAQRIEADGGKQQHKIEALAASGLPNALIADLLGTTSDTVRSALGKAKKRRKRDPSGTPQ